MSKDPGVEARVRIIVGDMSIEATLADSDAARDFASLLPLTLSMNDLFRREKFAGLPRAISEQGKRTHDYAVGTIGYWAPLLLTPFVRYAHGTKRQDKGRLS